MFILTLRKYLIECNLNIICRTLINWIRCFSPTKNIIIRVSNADKKGKDHRAKESQMLPFMNVDNLLRENIARMMN